MKKIILTSIFIFILVLSTHGFSSETKQLSSKTLQRQGQSSVKEIINENKICEVLAQQINTVQNLLKIKQRFPVLFDHCKLKIRIKNKIKCKRFAWKSRSVYC